MKKTKIYAVVLSTALVFSAFTACSSNKTTSNEATPSTTSEATPAPSSEAGQYKDGKYKATYDRNDVRIWKAFVELTVTGGKVNEVTYDYTNDKGEIRSDNKAYEEAFKNVNKVTPKEVFKELGTRLINSQDANAVDTYTGATHSTKNFKQLAAAALENAKKGETADAVIPLYQDGIYKVEYENFDSHGWKGQVEVEIKDHSIASVKFDYINKDGKLKSQDEEYKANMEPVSGTYPGKYIPELQDQLIQKQIISTVDAITGATTSSNEFKELVEYALDEMAEKGDTTPKTIPLPKE